MNDYEKNYALSTDKIYSKIGKSVKIIVIHTNKLIRMIYAQLVVSLKI